MSTSNRRKSLTVVEQLLDSPHAYSFFQAVRILERATLLQASKSPTVGRQAGGKNPLAGFVPPETEIIRLKSSSSLTFPESEIFSIVPRTSKTPAPPWTMQVNFIGLTGAMGVLPYHYTELLLNRVKQKDFSLASFLDFFNHRTTSLFYQASTKYNLPLSYERKLLHPGTPKKRDQQTQALLSLMGLGTKGLVDRLQIKDESLLFYGGLLTQSVRTSSGLRQVLQDYFEIPVKIQELVGQWQEFIPDVRTRLVSRQMPKGQNARVGQSAIIGHKGWFAQGKIRIVLGPLNREQFYRLAPGTKALSCLNDMVRMYVGMERDYDFVIEVKRKDMPRKIALRKEARPILGWDAWLAESEKDVQFNEEILRIKVSANRLK